MRHISKIMAIAMMATGMASCEPEQPINNNGGNGGEPATQDPLRGVALVLNEGGWGANEASISLLVDNTTGETENDWFAAKNGRGLGDVAQDMVAYGSKIYVTVWGSKSLEVIDRNSSRSRHISLGEYEPRYMSTHDGKVYISCYSPNSVIRIDTATLQVEATCQLGNYNPEGMAIANGKIFVASQKMGLGNNEFAFDNKVYVIDIASFASTGTVTVGMNPNKVMVYNSQYVVVNCFGEYNASTYSYIDPKVAFINTETHEATIYDYDLTDFDVYNNTVYGFCTSYGNNMYVQLAGDPSNITYISSIMDSGVKPYKININQDTGDEYLTTTGDYIANGDVRFTSQDRTRKWSSQVGMLPTKVVFL